MKQIFEWIPADNPPGNNRYIWLNFENFDLPIVGRYEDDGNGGGSYYVGDETETALSQNMIVSAWGEIPNKHEKDEGAAKDNLHVGDELIWNDDSRSVVIALNDNTFHELTQFGGVFEQCYPDGKPGYRHSGRNFKEIVTIVEAMNVEAVRTET